MLHKSRESKDPTDRNTDGVGRGVEGPLEGEAGVGVGGHGAGHPHLRQPRNLVHQLLPRHTRRGVWRKYFEQLFFLSFI